MANPAIPLEDRLIVALDVASVADARARVERLGDSVRFYKIGLQLQFAGGIEFARELIAAGKKVFLDAKLLDIDQTVAGAVASIAALGVDFVTVHGHRATIAAAVAGRGTSRLKILSVTALTSLDAHDMAELGLTCSVQDLVLKRVRTALDAGADGVVASGEEAKAIRALAGARLLVVTPGIRSEGVPQDDQKRTATPRQAIATGADYLVVGRQILRDPDPPGAARQIIGEIAAGLAATRGGGR